MAVARATRPDPRPDHPELLRGEQGWEGRGLRERRGLREKGREQGGGRRAEGGGLRKKG